MDADEGFFQGPGNLVNMIMCRFLGYDVVSETIQAPREASQNNGKALQSFTALTLDRGVTDQRCEKKSGHIRLNSACGH